MIVCSITERRRKYEYTVTFSTDFSSIRFTDKSYSFASLLKRLKQDFALWAPHNTGCINIQRVIDLAEESYYRGVNSSNRWVKVR